MEHQSFFVTQNAVIMNEKGRALILHHNSDPERWLLPGGKIAKDNQRQANWNFCSKEILKYKNPAWGKISNIDSQKQTNKKLKNINPNKANNPRIKGTITIKLENFPKSW